MRIITTIGAMEDMEAMATAVGAAAGAEDGAADVIDPPASYRLILWDNLMPFFTSQRDKAFCEKHLLEKVSLTKTSGPLDYFRGSVIENWQQNYQHCFEHCHVIKTNEFGQFLLRRIPVIPVDRSNGSLTDSADEKSSFVSSAKSLLMKSFEALRKSFCLPELGEKGEGSENRTANGEENEEEEKETEEEKQIMQKYCEKLKNEDKTAAENAHILLKINIIPLQSDGKTIISPNPPFYAIQWVSGKIGIKLTDFVKVFCLPFFSDDPLQKCAIDYHSLDNHNKEILNIFNKWLNKNKGNSDFVKEHLSRFSVQVPNLMSWKRMSKIDAELFSGFGTWIWELCVKNKEKSNKNENFAEILQWSEQICVHLNKYFGTINENVVAFAGSNWQKICKM
ncbi:hypothetical protein niasHT_022280 [Heterodera trifolii]|uniref:Uncharacterized protein n=1 Tax=Heterodera trifolii TaxID=157864 RepID=A0ABD2KA99_9BILA